MNKINHVAIIMDGNDRFAAIKNISSQEGYKAGAENAFHIIESAIELGVKHLSLYTFSSENLLRPKDEVENFMNLLNYYATSELQRLADLNIKVKFVGDLSLLDAEIQLKLAKAEKLSENNTAINVYMLLSYGSRAEIINATKRILDSKITSAELDVDVLTSNFYCPSMPDVDLLIRPGDRMRISNFLLWQSAYAELYFSNKLWPEFSKEDLKVAIEEYNSRIRTFGMRNNSRMDPNKTDNENANVT